MCATNFWQFLYQQIVRYMEADNTTRAVIWVVVGLVYFLPSIISVAKRHTGVGAFFLLNLLAAWTVIGWPFLLISVIQLPRGGAIYKPQSAREPVPEPLPLGTSFHDELWGFGPISGEIARVPYKHGVFIVTSQELRWERVVGGMDRYYLRDITGVGARRKNKLVLYSPMFQYVSAGFSHNEGDETEFDSTKARDLAIQAVKRALAAV
jgi:hypothetical protein